MSRTAEIKLTVDLDADNLPTRIEWYASEGQENGPAACHSMMLSLWDSEKKDDRRNRSVDQGYDRRGHEPLFLPGDSQDGRHLFASNKKCRYGQIDPRVR